MLAALFLCISCLGIESLDLFSLFAVILSWLMSCWVSPHTHVALYGFEPYKFGVNVRDAALNILYVYLFPYSMSANAHLQFLKLFPYNSEEILSCHPLS